MGLHGVRSDSSSSLGNNLLRGFGSSWGCVLVWFLMNTKLELVDFGLCGVVKVWFLMNYRNWNSFDELQELELVDWIWVLVVWNSSFRNSSFTLIFHGTQVLEAQVAIAKSSL